MRDLGSCFSEYGIQVADTSCTGNANKSCISPSMTPSIPNAVTCSYKTSLSNKRQLLITVSWCKNNVSQGLSISFGSDPTSVFKLNTSSRLFMKKKGKKSVEFHNCRAKFVYDLSAARYNSGPEPIDGYYVLVMIDSEIALVLGEMAEEAFTRKVKAGRRIAKFSLISRQEHLSGDTLYSTKAQFCVTGTTHDILIDCRGTNEGLKYPVLSVFIDKKMVIQVKRLQWNFRGYQSIFIDGLVIDVMWDVHDWFYNPVPGFAMFMFRTRSGSDNRLWLDEKLMKKDEDKVEYSLLICASKNS